MDLLRTCDSLFNSNSRHNNCLIELSQNEVKRLGKLTIHLSSMALKNGCISYHNVKYGEKLSTSSCHKKLCGNKKSRWIDLNKTKKNMLVITASKAECLSMMPNTYVFNSHNYDEKHMSGIVILMMAVLRNNREEYIWMDDMHTLVASCKSNSLKTYSHYGTEGFVYSFGNKPNYGNANGSSVSIYSTKRSKNEDLTKFKSDDANFVEDKCKDCLKNGIEKISKYIPDISLLLSPIINTAYWKQCKDDINLLHMNAGSDIGCWNTIMFVDGRTNEYHRENDCSYTYITVPRQNMIKDRQCYEKPHFSLKIDEERVIMLPLLDNISFFYNASFLMHRQSYTPIADGVNNCFFNVSSYSNEKLFNHLRKSFNRLNSK